jgi:[CysO sulfur-carrier protein]-S-L-cysteine hydrolase
MPLVISRTHLDAMIDQARREQPRECCGLLAGRDGEVLGVIQTTNADRSPISFRVDPLELLRAFEGIDHAGLDLIGIYHSHPASAALMSETDLKYAPGYPDAAHVIISLADDPHVAGANTPTDLISARRTGDGQAGPDVRAFRVINGLPVAEEVLIR